MSSDRTANLLRQTKETKIELAINLDGRGEPGGCHAHVAVNRYEKRSDAAPFCRPDFLPSPNLN